MKDGFDRVQGVESYDKEFKPLYVGMMYLKEGIGEIRLSAKKKAGEEICQVRAIQMTLNEPADAIVQRKE